MAASLPPTLKPINSFLKLAKEYDKRDEIVSYFCRMFAVQKGIKLDSKTPQCKTFLFGLMDQLETKKSELVAKGQESVSNDIVGQAHLENIAVSLFTWADTEDRNSVFNKNVVKAFYSSSLLYDVLTQFGELSEECKVQQKYAKWKATEIHRCLQSGETPKPGPTGTEFEMDFGSASNTSSSNVVPSDTTTTGGASVPYPPAAGGFSYTQPGNNQQITPVPAPRKPSQPTQPGPSSSYAPNTSTGGDAGFVDLSECSKLCKFAMSALNYEDVDTAIDNLTKALAMLKATKK